MAKKRKGISRSRKKVRSGKMNFNNQFSLALQESRNAASNSRLIGIKKYWIRYYNNLSGKLTKKQVNRLNQLMYELSVLEDNEIYVDIEGITLTARDDGNVDFFDLLDNWINAAIEVNLTENDKVLQLMIQKVHITVRGSKWKDYLPDYEAYFAFIPSNGRLSISIY